ncbi:hypothetical protein A3780_15210 [Kosakonia radicincitans]|uniref:hypothetical protein n=1 Tax=Kosakonia radicincitans TaxID=283686 RepID=UPI0009043E9D|nr:hypothetical protein [Kosakonia radicincitans]APG18845.1 hypothetical protein A3780_15210 [Kosakonia radicincitans]
MKRNILIPTGVLRAKVVNDVKLNTNAKGVLGALCEASYECPIIMLTYTETVHILAISRKTAIRCIDTLEKSGLIKTMRTAGETNTYVIDWDLVREIGEAFDIDKITTPDY